ncbi:hypothetical protein ZOD2009_20273 [Haladaptatus paucihalophilus DX253]|uniref:Uncharacterized protein n=1 Tax=Haladaptatus paucihalophilus DX253 TaxID=797209 RepID=E7QZ14_HALPU|nr:DUF5805 domain-containing protein [Haladaptatus paucihalophilus]EFW90430.1 hypothetical protein ZOD2009_20273 [Haladaptatus paucihalophilus DX253]SHK04346.1 hypothetical protein SAMN05444342_0377 [Haladaptatus paucihalophilus DX253]
MADDGTERTVVKTYIPKYQKEEWQAHADELDMSQSEFVRSMVQAGRRGFEMNPVEDHSGGSNPRGSDLETRVLESLAREDNMSWDELVERLAGNFEDRLDEVLNELQAKNRVQYSGRHGGYVLVGGVDGDE